MATGAPNPDKTGTAQQLSTQDDEATRNNNPTPELSLDEYLERITVKTFIVHGMTPEEFLKQYGMTGTIAKPSDGTGGDEEDPHGPKSTSTTEKK